MDDNKPTPAALFGLFDEELNERVLAFRQQALAKGLIHQSESLQSLPHFTIAWKPDFDFRHADALKGMLEERTFPPTQISVERIAPTGGDIALFFDKEKTRLWVREVGDVATTFLMDVVFTDHIKLLKTTFIKGREEELIALLQQILPNEIDIKTVGFGGKLLREEDLAWKVSLSGDYLKVRLKL